MECVCPTPAQQDSLSMQEQPCHAVCAGSSAELCPKVQGTSATKTSRTMAVTSHLSRRAAQACCVFIKDHKAKANTGLWCGEGALGLWHGVPTALCDTVLRDGQSCLCPAILTTQNAHGTQDFCCLALSSSFACTSSQHLAQWTSLGGKQAACKHSQSTHQPQLPWQDAGTGTCRDGQAQRSC